MLLPSVTFDGWGLATEDSFAQKYLLQVFGKQSAAESLPIVVSTMVLKRT